MTPNHSSDKQRGSLLIIALGSLMVVGTVAAGLNALIVQDAGTSANTIEAMRNTSINDSLYLFEREKLEKETEWSFVFNEETESLEVLDKNDNPFHDNPTRKWVREELSARLSKSDLEDFRKNVRHDLDEQYQ